MGADKTFEDLIEPIDTAFEPVTLDEIRRIEELVRAPLPISYASFLTRIGSCMFAGDATVRAVNGQELGIATLYGGRSSRSVLEDLQRHEDYIAAQLVPIADTFFGDRYVLELASGKVRYIEYDFGGNRVIEVASSFEDFLKRISVKPYHKAL